MDAILETLEVAAITAQKEVIPEEWRVRLLSAASNLVTALQRPEETVMRESFWMGRSMAVRVLQDLSVFDHITAKLPPYSMTSGYVVELDEATYGPNRLTQALTNKQIKGMFECIFDGGMEMMGKMPAYLAKKGYKNPDDQADGPLQYHWFPVQEKLLDDLHRPIAPDSILYVDVAGGRGHDLLAFKKKFDHIPGKYYLFDVPHIVNHHTLDLGDRVQRVAFDFFQDQVISDSRIYFMKFVLHDWSDEKCLAILKNVTSSMERGYSQLIIEDFILLPTGAALLPTLFDMQMITFLAGMEQTEKQWCVLLDRAGLIIDGFHQPPGDGTGIIVTQLK
ncbi:hypothetical protein B5807_09921 [Epicoccum nigrum]|uniref:O-methyltransferase C-terminal domain-containing protein n=1 Tax=Epicoccum nigrum TaxID=105696 RepID=A0A1Y2LTZ8_EPING|nr:hypothetical protein B5807_09921 [Epicoccum nigrum]